MLKETDANFIMVDKRAATGGHWNDAYPFVRLHQPSACYGVASRALGHGRTDSTGFNQGLLELASGFEVTDYFHQLMRDTFLASFYPMSELVGKPGSGTYAVRSLLSGDTRTVDVRKRLVDATMTQEHSADPRPQVHPGRWRDLRSAQRPGATGTKVQALHRDGSRQDVYRQRLVPAGQRRAAAKHHLGVAARPLAVEPRAFPAGAGLLRPVYRWRRTPVRNLRHGQQRARAVPANGGGWHLDAARPVRVADHVPRRDRDSPGTGPSARHQEHGAPWAGAAHRHARRAVGARVAVLTPGDPVCGLHSTCD